VPMHHARMLHDGITGSQLVIIDGADHALIWTHSGELVRVTEHSSVLIEYGEARPWNRAVLVLRWPSRSIASDRPLPLTSAHSPGMASPSRPGARHLEAEPLAKRRRSVPARGGPVSPIASVVRAAQLASTTTP
jgi:hypothetical protein